MRIGLIGYGKGGRFFHAPLIASLPGGTFAGVVTGSPERRQALARDYPGVPAFDSLADLAAAGVDTVVVSTPLSSRPALVHEAIQRGIPVVSDKPFAHDAAQAQWLVDASRQHRVLLGVYQNRRWDSDFLTLLRLIGEGRLGSITRFESSIERYSPRSVGKASGGGLLRDLGSHLVDQALVLFGPVARVYAELEFLDADTPYDHGFFIALTHHSGAISHLRGHCLQNAPAPRFRVSGSRGCYHVDGLDCQEGQSFAGLSPKADAWGVEETSRWGWFEQGEARERVPSERGCWPAYYRQWLDAVAGRGPNPVDPCDAVVACKVLDAARLSAEQGRVVAL